MAVATIKHFVKGTTTPLASIFGSGFLVIVSVLAGVVGSYSIIAVACICLLAYMIGGVIRFNIVHAEPALHNETLGRTALTFEILSNIALIPAYVISITLYLRILSSYGLGFLEMDTDQNEQILTTGIIVFILLVGVIKGLAVLERFEKWALIATMVIIAGLIAAFATYNISMLTTDAMIFPDYPNRHPWDVLTILAGTVIIVQGFETTRYLGDEYDPQTRVRACRNAQIISTVVYLIFVALATPLMHFLSDTVSENALMSLAKIVAIWLPVPLVAAAVLSQFSAATADTIGASGNILEFFRHHIGEKATYILICVFAIVLTWTSSTLEILALASRAFAFYYLMQSMVALSITKSPPQRIYFSVLSTVLAFVVVFAVPVS